MHRVASQAVLLFFMKANRFLPKVVALVFILAVFVYGGYLLLQGSDITVPSLFRPAPAPGARLLMSMDGFRFSKSENGRVSWLMNAKNADLYESKEAQLKELEIFFINQDGKEAVLRGDTGTMDTTSGNGSIHRGAREVRIITSDGYLLTTDSLFWKTGERIIWTEDAFKLLGSEIYLEGVGLSANLDMRTIVVKDNVKAVLQK
jgi:LPS export ABC transporter protein LptC